MTQISPVCWAGEAGSRTKRILEPSADQRGHEKSLPATRRNCVWPLPSAFMIQSGAPPPWEVLRRKRIFEPLGEKDGCVSSVKNCAPGGWPVVSSWRFDPSGPIDQIVLRPTALQQRVSEIFPLPLWKAIENVAFEASLVVLTPSVAVTRTSAWLLAMSRVAPTVKCVAVVVPSGSQLVPPAPLGPTRDAREAESASLAS